MTLAHQLTKEQSPSSSSSVTTPGKVSPTVTTTSGSSEIALAQHLTQNGAKVYGAYWCANCHAQKELFGKQAVAQLSYVECDPSGQNAQTDLCKTKKIKAYVTWEINGQMYPGTQSLQKLAKLSGYKGTLDFINK